jgi:hypothetical protein
VHLSLRFLCKTRERQQSRIKFVVQPYRERKIHSFDTLSDFIDFSELLSSDVAESMIEHNRSLASELRLYFPLCPGEKKQLDENSLS